MPLPAPCLYPEENIFPDDDRDSDEDCVSVAVTEYQRDFVREDFYDDEEVLELIAHFIEAVDNA